MQGIRHEQNAIESIANFPLQQRRVKEQYTEECRIFRITGSVLHKNTTRNMYFSRNGPSLHYERQHDNDATATKVVAQ